MDKTKFLYAIYKYDFHKAVQRTIQAEADGIDGTKYVWYHFASPLLLKIVSSRA